MSDAAAGAGALRFAVVILAGRAAARDRERIDEMVATARALGAEAIVCAVPKGWRAPTFARVVHVAPGAAAISALRLAMAQLGNSPARHALLWPLGASTDDTRLRTLLDDVAREPAPLAALAGDDLDHEPVLIARGAWLDLMTLGEQGMTAVAERVGMRRVAGAI